MISRSQKWQNRWISTLTYLLMLKRRALALFSLTERSLSWYCQLSFVSIFTPRYLTLSVEYIYLLPLNFIFKSLLNFFCLDLKLPFQFCFTLSEILFAFNQLTRCFKSALTSLFSFLIELPRHNRLVSSAKWWTLQNFIDWFRSFIYNKKSKGSRTDPWGTPQFIAARPESYPFINTYCLWLDRYDLNQSFETPRNP